MHIKNYRWICLWLILIVSFAGMCFEESKTHSSFECVQEECTYIKQADIRQWDDQLCTTGMLRAQNDMNVYRQVNRVMNQKRELRFSLEYICSNIFTLEQGKFFSSSAVVSFSNLYSDELVASFVHKADGKKRV